MCDPAYMRTGVARGTAALLAMLVLGAGATTLTSGCGESAQNKEAQQLENVSVLSSTAPLQSRIVKRSEIDAASDTYAVRTFLQLWSRLQFESWPAALELFEPGLRAAVGDSNLTQAFKAYTLLWQGSKPGVVNKRVNGNLATIEFVTRDEKNNLTPSSITFRRAGAGWLVAYMSLLDSALQRSVQTRVQAAVEPLATKRPAAEAVRQGFAALVLQSNYFQKELGTIAAEERRRAGSKGP
jgi:hypothetical protein